MIKSRFSGHASVEFEFHRPETEPLTNRVTLFVSHVLVNFATAPTTAGDVQIFISDDAGEDLIWEAEAMNKTHLSFSPALHVPVTNRTKLILRYANADSGEVTARFLWRV